MKESSTENKKIRIPNPPKSKIPTSSNESITEVNEEKWSGSFEK